MRLFQLSGSPVSPHVVAEYKTTGLEHGCKDDSRQRLLKRFAVNKDIGADDQVELLLGVGEGQVLRHDFCFDGRDAASDFGRKAYHLNGVKCSTE